MSKRQKFRKGRSGKSFALKMNENEDVDTAEDSSVGDETEVHMGQSFSFGDEGESHHNFKNNNDHCDCENELSGKD